MGVVSNASGQIEAMLARSLCQVGPGSHVSMRVIVDSHVVGVVPEYCRTASVRFNDQAFPFRISFFTKAGVSFSPAITK